MPTRSVAIIEQIKCPCYDCGRESDKDKGLARFDKMRICKKCVKNYFVCSQCGKLDKKNRSWFKQIDLCTTCFGERYFMCVGCKEVFDREDYAEQPGCRCIDCYVEWVKKDGIRNVYRKVEENWLVKEKNLRKSVSSFNIAGAELETLVIGELDVMCPELRHWGITDDASIDGHGIPKEFLIPPFDMTKTEQRRLIKDGMKKLATACKVNSSCGYHAHLYMHPDLITTINLKKILLGYIRAEDFFFKMVPGSRRKNDFCKSLKAYDSNQILKTRGMFRLLSYYYDERIKNEYDIPENYKMDNNGKRYHWVNLHSLYYRNTVEIRLHAGTTNWRKFIHWLRVHRNFLRWLIFEAELPDIMNLTYEKWLEVCTKKSTTLDRYIKGRINAFKDDSVEYVSRERTEEDEDDGDSGEDE